MGLSSYAGGDIRDVPGYQGAFGGSFAVGLMAVVLGVTLRPPAGGGSTAPKPGHGRLTPVSR